MTTTRIDNSALITARAFDRASEYLDRALGFIGSAESVAPLPEYIGAPKLREALAVAVEAVEAAQRAANDASTVAWHATLNA